MQQPDDSPDKPPPEEEDTLPTTSSPTPKSGRKVKLSKWRKGEDDLEC